MTNGVNEKNLEPLREALEKRREDIFSLREKVIESFQGLQEEEVEFEESAAKETMSLGLDELDEQEKREIEAIDTALRRMETGDYGLCRACGKFISPARLEAIPWTPICARCAGGREEAPGVAATQGTVEAELPPDYEGLSDNELETAVYEKLRNDGRVELEEFQIHVKDGVIHLNGALPGETSHQILLGILEDTMGLHEIEDNLRLDELPWQRQDREPQPGLKKTEDEEVFQGEDINEEVFHSRKSGKPLSPPDKLVPEKEES